MCKRRCLIALTVLALNVDFVGSQPILRDTKVTIRMLGPYINDPQVQAEGGLAAGDIQKTFYPKETDNPVRYGPEKNRDKGDSLARMKTTYSGKQEWRTKSKKKLYSLSELVALGLVTSAQPAALSNQRHSLPLPKQPPNVKF